MNDLESFKLESDSRTKLLMKTVIRQDEIIQDLMQQVIHLKREKLRKNLVISGLEEESGEKGKDLKVKVENFFKEKLEIPEEQKVPVKNVRRNGPKEWKDRSVTVSMCTMEGKLAVFKHATNLKGKSNARKKLYFIDDDMDPEQAEKEKMLQTATEREREFIRGRANGGEIC